MSKEKTFLRIVTYSPLFFIPLFFSIIMLLSYQVYSIGFDSSIKELKKDLLQHEEEAVKNKVNNLSKLIVYQKSRIKEELLSRVKARVRTAHEIANNIYNKYKNTKSEDEIKVIINNTLKSFTWNDGESYIWIMDYLGIHYLIENKEDLQGTSFIDFQDSKGRHVIQEEIAICKENGEGYLWDTFTKPEKNSSKQFEQVAFVKAFEPYDWCLGSAEFLDTATKKTNKFLFDMIGHVDKIGHNYVVIIDGDGNLLVHSQLPQFVGENVEITDPLVLDTIENLRSAIEGKQETSYIYDWLNFSTKKIEKKYAYLQRIPNTEWFIGSGFFLSEVENQLEKQKVTMYEMHNANTRNISYVAVLILLTSLVFSFFVSQKIKKRFIKYELRIGEKNKELKELNVSLEEKVHTRTIELEKIKDDFERLATTDALTHIHNRYSIMNILSDEINRCKRYNHPLCVIMYDIDFFKVVNDTHGHDIGDKILVTLSSLVSDSTRDVDSLGRYGGEEFLIIMPNTLLKDATNYAQRLRQTVEEHHFSDVGNITVSMGIVQHKNDENIDFMFKRVDDLLYISKNNGRNRVSY